MSDEQKCSHYAVYVAEDTGRAMGRDGWFCNSCGHRFVPAGAELSQAAEVVKDAMREAGREHLLLRTIEERIRALAFDEAPKEKTKP